MKETGIVVIRGGGDIATGVIQKFFRSGIPLLILETENPTAIRRSVALCEAVYTGYSRVEDVDCVRIDALSSLDFCRRRRLVPMLIDPDGKSIARIKPVAVIDAILAKRNCGTYKSMAPVTIGLGPGFCAGEDVHAVIETMRGHNLGRLILRGHACPNTGIPGEVGGQSDLRVIHAPLAGKISHIRQIGDKVVIGDDVCEISGRVIKSPLDGILRGLIHEGQHVKKDMKIADIDPRFDTDWHTISDKARCIGGAVLEAFFYLSHS